MCRFIQRKCGLGLDTDQPVRQTAPPSRDRTVDEPLTPPRSELDHREQPIGLGNRLKERDPFEVVFVRDRQAAYERASLREVNQVFVEREEGNTGAGAEKIDVPAGIDLPRPRLELVEDWMMLGVVGEDRCLTP